MNRRGTRVAAVVLALAPMLGLAPPARGQAGMPDPSLMAGQSLPAPELPDGTITVRVMRETVGNNAVGETVELVAGNERRTAVTDEEGRAEFPGLLSGIQGTATATVDGETLVSAPFTVPASGGLRVILISGLTGGGADAPTVPAIEGTVAMGPGSRIIAQFQEDVLQMFYLLEVLNEQRAPVDIGGPLEIALPAAAAGASTLAASTPAATVNGNVLTVTGPFQPGVTSVQVGFSLPGGSSDLEVSQTWPVPVDGLSVAVERVPGLTVSSEQFLSTGQLTADDGTPYFAGDLPPLPASATFTLQLSGLPVYNTLPRTIAFVLAGVLLVGGAWLAWTGRVDDDQARARLAARRDTLLGDLARLEARRRAGRDAPRDAERRQQLTAELEQLYAELDTAGTPRGGGGDVAA